MQYFGGKARIKHYIAPFLNAYDLPYYEPFVGGGSILSATAHKQRVASDSNPYLVALYKAMQQGYTPPDTISENEYAHIRNNKEILPPELVGFVGFASSFGGKWFGGYARDPKSDRNYTRNGRNSLMKRFAGMSAAEFIHQDYRNLSSSNSIIYCDPPYVNTTGFDAVDAFDTNEFWGTVKQWARNNVVFVSEYTAPDWAECVWAKDVRTDIKGKTGKGLARQERLYKIGG